MPYFDNDENYQSWIKSLEQYDMMDIHRDMKSMSILTFLEKYKNEEVL